MYFQEQNSYQIKEQIRKHPVAILPIGAVEAHGPHLPLGTDNFLAEKLSERLAEQVDGWIMPTLPYGQVWSLSDFPGSLTVSNESLISMLVDIGLSLYQQGFVIWVMLNGHYGNAVALKEAARILYEKVPKLKVFTFFYPGTQKIIREVRESEPVHSSYFHACELETSYMLYLQESMVDMNQAINDQPTIPLEADSTPTPWSEFTQTAVLGDATLATREKGEKIIQVALHHMTLMVEKAKKEIGNGYGTI